MPYTSINWVKLKLELLSDHRFIEECDDTDKLLFMGLLLLAGATQNKIPSNPKFIKRMLNLQLKEVEITQKITKIQGLFKGLIGSSDYLKWRSFNELHNWFGSSKGVPKELQEKIRVEKSRIDEILNYFRDHYKQKFNTTYIVEWGRDSKAIKGLLSELSPEEIKGAVDNFFSSQDKFVLGSDYSIGLFKYVINKLRTTKVSYE